MKKKFGIILALACIGITCFAAGCANETEMERYQREGYTVMVTYDANGGAFLNRQGITIMDLFKPSDYLDEDGVARIKLREPTDLARPTSGTGNVTVTKQKHFFVGWYQNRELRKNDDGQVLSEAGDILEEIDGKFVYTGTTTEATPAYNYSGYWDFQSDVIEYSQTDGLFEMTLYAAWVPYYQFDYYYRTEGETEWTYLSSTTFDYKTTKAEGSTTHDKDTIWLPDWKDGAMNYSYRYADNSAFEFPKVDGTTFKAAYTDADCTEKIEGSFEHKGTVDQEQGIAVDRVQNIYIEVENGERFIIDTAEKFSQYAKLNGIYEITADLDFKNGEVDWPKSFVGGEFKGQIYSVGDATYTFQNVSAKLSATSASYGGLFGKISASATVKNVKFDNVTMDFTYLSTRTSDATFGTFAGYIDENANVSNVSVNGKLRLGEVTLELASDYKLHLIANGALDGIVSKKCSVEVYGKKYGTLYQYSFAPNNVVVDESSGTVTLDYSKTNKENRVEQDCIFIGTYEI